MLNMLALAATTNKRKLWIICYEDGVETGIGTRAEILSLDADGIFGAPVFVKAA